MLPVYKNLFTNPNLVGNGTWAEVQRNLAPSPQGHTGSYSVGGTVSTVAVSSPLLPPSVSSASRIEWVSAPTGSPTSLNQGGTGTDGIVVTAGETYTASMYTRRSFNLSAERIDFTFYDAAGGLVLHSNGPTIVGMNPAHDWVRQSRTMQAPSGAVYMRVLNAHSGPQTNGAGGYLEVTGWLIEKSATVNTFFDGSTKPAGIVQPEDFRVRWLGAVNASESVMEIERVARLTASYCIAGVSTRDGKPAVRLIPTGANTDSRASVVTVPAGFNGTLLGTLHIGAPLTGTLKSDSSLRLTATSPWSTLSPAAPNEVGVYPQRFVFPARTAAAQARINHGGSLGSGDVWWTDIGLFAGTYDGPAFDGSSGVVVIDGEPYDTFWTGVPDNSSSLAILSEGGYSGSIYDTLYVLSTVSNSWSRWQTPAAQGRRPVTLARVTNSPPAEAYTMRVSRRIFDEVRDLYTTPY